ncbi:benzoate/H(+) symporter BenE family transporter [Kocuria palustris]|jgi:benzoate membrane transport protein|uniref:benzoate/H(+) symporter BenE family transporter n=1 Tax=Kocuria palustris TaxID=71999 RepID=UPI0019D30B16|nr:benzoate/H(+) symporter BenE family transporter [Kocuria palustris]MBN6754247.1 benzoate/H(+) symporter BenE family transporter [Kocuria palustris]MBN6759207.1 benzoate/H(+) symporter BenE family transporter [Kocuria palustris]MBN6764247.1 benzoate/H(+) symporter BenE family transporter [Kocuria palustris]MBN6783726.1 benzoate/H(+) symporter BenE family transporter [Kocuria palustris]MBN6800208.1 benzoate/H(+) symporter BenE family transporter [Kocuria palustris]
MATSHSPKAPSTDKGKPLIERGPGFRSGLGALPKHLNPATIGAGLVAAIFGCTGPALIVINGAQEAGLTPVQTASWIFGIYVFGGLISLLMALYYQQPVTGAYSIPGAVLVVGALQGFTFAEMIGAYLVAGLIVLILGLTGVVRKVITWIPFPIVMAMIAGALIRFGTGVVDSLLSAPIIVGAAIVGYILLSRFIKAIPGVLGALVIGGVAAAITGSFGAIEGDVGLIMPELVAPAFNIGAILAVGVPLALLVIGAENTQAMGVLMAERYRPPFNAMTIVSGIGGLLAPLFGGHNANIAGPMTAICASDQAGENKAGRYAATVVNGIIFGLFGIFAGIAVALVTALPKELTATLAGLAMIGVLLSAFQSSFSEKRFQLGAFVALVIAMSGVTLFGISAPFWALVGGVFASLMLETKDFRFREEINAMDMANVPPAAEASPRVENQS